MTVNKTQLPQHEQAHLRTLLDSEGFKILLRVVQSRAFELEAEIANKAVMNTSGYESQAKESANRALEAHAAKKLLLEIAAMKSFSVSSSFPSDIESANTKPK